MDSLGLFSYYWNIKMTTVNGSCVNTWFVLFLIILDSSYALSPGQPGACRTVRGLVSCVVWYWFAALLVCRLSSDVLSLGYFLPSCWTQNFQGPAVWLFVNLVCTVFFDLIRWFAICRWVSIQTCYQAGCFCDLIVCRVLTNRTYFVWLSLDSEVSWVVRYHIT